MKTIKRFDLSKVKDPELMILINALSCEQGQPPVTASKRVFYKSLPKVNEREREKLTQINRQGQAKSRKGEKGNRISGLL